MKFSTLPCFGSRVNAIKNGMDRKAFSVTSYIYCLILKNRYMNNRGAVEGA